MSRNKELPISKRKELVSLIQRAQRFNDKWPLSVRVVLTCTEDDLDLFAICVPEFHIKDEVSFVINKRSLEESLKKSDLKNIKPSRRKAFEKDLKSIISSIVLF